MYQGNTVCYIWNQNQSIPREGDGKRMEPKGSRARLTPAQGLLLRCPSPSHCISSRKLVPLVLSSQGTCKPLSTIYTHLWQKIKKFTPFSVNTASLFL